MRRSNLRGSTGTRDASRRPPFTDYAHARLYPTSASCRIDASCSTMPRLGNIAHALRTASIASGTSTLNQPECAARSAGEQEAIERGFVGETNAGRDFVDPHADGPDRARPPQFIKGAIRSVHCLAKSAFIGLGGSMRPDIDVVNECDVDPIHAKPLIALLQCAHCAVVTVIVDRLEIEPADELTAIDLFAARGP